MGNDPDKIGSSVCKENYIRGIKTALVRSDARSTLILETGTGCGNEVSTTLEELGDIRKGLTDSEKNRVKYCLDTCHLFAAGYAIDDPSYLKVFEIEIDNNLGWENVVVVHLNDSKDKFNSHKDNHDDIGKGEMNFYGLMKFVDICVRRKIPMILETPCNFYNEVQFTHVAQMKLIRDYHRIIHSAEYGGPEVTIITRTNTHKEIKEAKKLALQSKSTKSSKSSKFTKSSKSTKSTKSVKSICSE